MKFDYLKEKDRLVPYALLGISAVLAVLTLVKVVGFFVTSARAQSIVAKAVEQGEPDETLVQKNLAGFAQIADALKKKNLFVPPPPKRNPVTAVLGIMGSEALINGKWYKAGDRIADAKVVAVEPTRVKIEWNGQEKYFAPLASAGGSSPSGPGGRPDRRDRSGETRGPRPDAVMAGPGPEGGRGGFGNLSEEQRAEMRARMEGMRARFENMSPEQRERFREEMRGRFGGRGPGGMDGGRGGPGGGRGGPGGGGRR